MRKVKSWQVLGIKGQNPFLFPHPLNDIVCLSPTEKIDFHLPAFSCTILQRKN